MKNIHILIFFLVLAYNSNIRAQNESIINLIIEEASKNSQLEILGQELLDGIGPRLVGTPQMKNAHDWAVNKYKQWGINSRSEKFGTWRGWERGITHIDMVHPRVQSLKGTQLAWSPSTSDKGIRAEVIVIPEIKDSLDFVKWLPSVKNKIVLISKLEPTGRPDYNWKEFATQDSFEKMKLERKKSSELWNQNIRNTGYSRRNIHKPLEEHGAAAIISSYWSKGFGVNKIFSARTKKIPTIDLELEDYTMIYRLTLRGENPILEINSKSKELGEVPTFNTIGEIKGVENPDQYVILSAHFDSWDGGTGATDNGTGSLVMMEAMRVLKKVYPNPKRTILVGHWGSEEQGLNGSRAFVEDHPDIIKNIQAVFNQDNGTGRVVNISGQGFLNSYDYIGRWLNKVPEQINKHIETIFPGSPSRGGSDYASFVAAGVPAFSLSSLDWSYRNYTWHTNRDTYDKIIFDDVRSNVILTAILTYMASEDQQTTSREKSILPLDKRTGKKMNWPSQRPSNRKGGY